MELVQSDFAEYEFPKEIEGVFATGALSYSQDYDKVIKEAHDSLKKGKKFSLLDFKMSKGSARIFAPLIVACTKPFSADEEYLKATAWKSMEKYFEKTTFQEGWGGFLYLSVGKKA